MARLTKKEKEVVFRAVTYMSELADEGRAGIEFGQEEAKDLNSARLKLRMEIYGF